MDCIFCKIVSKEIKSNIIYEDKNIIVFDDIKPAANVHVLIVPKKHIESLSVISEEDKDIVSDIIFKAKEIAKIKGIKDFRLVSNSGKEAGQEIFHLHFHLLGGQKLGKLC
ncbi:MAG TPA: histidine triad nucleotide-binding protein [Spirochaetota bacterium]|nr:histidine triad nucleotide-binding protein [Spirochaetota bacterium]HOM38273.1 histidine triad nucleotide-binding protein [Spirochaetota bacterium]HPQ48509.1 histidine triad nucleotide-binding protein [Spirochaetota bacterium]